MVAVVALLKLVALLPCTAAWWWQQTSTTRPEIKALPTFADLLSPPSLPTLRELLNLSSVAGLQEHDRGPAAISLEEEWYEYSDVPLDRMDRVGHDYYYYYDYPEDREAGQASLSPLAAIIAPLAGLALMGAAAAMAVNPLLLSLVTISRRRRRSLGSDGVALRKRLRQLKILKQFLSSLPEKASPTDRLTADYLTWSGLEAGQCLQLLACSYATNSTSYATNSSQLPAKREVAAMTAEKEVAAIVLYNLMVNRLVGGRLKGRLRSAARAGRSGVDCKNFSCDFPESSETE